MKHSSKAILDNIKGTGGPYYLSVTSQRLLYVEKVGPENASNNWLK